MTDLSSMIRDAFQDDSLPAADRDRLWSTMQRSKARQARVKVLVRTGLLLLAGFVIAAALFVRNAIRSSSVPIDRVPVATDSISNNSPVERSMAQETHQEVPSNLIPLLPHRSQLTMELRSLEDRQLQLAQVISRVPPGTEHDVATRQLKSVEQQLEATRIAISVIDAQLAGQPVPTPPEVTNVVPSPALEVFPPLSDEFIWTSGGPIVLLALGMIAMLGYMRRIARKTREALAAIERQVSSQHATLASGIDAIAVEVERLGEGQRFMSKALAGPEAKPAPISRT